MLPIKETFPSATARALAAAAAFACALAWAPVAAADGPYLSGGTTVEWQDNVTNASSGAGILGAFSASVTGGATWLKTLDFSTLLSLGMDTGAEAWARYDRLDRVSAGPRLELKHKWGLGPFAPVLLIDVSADATLVGDGERSNASGEVRAAYSQRWTDGLQTEIGAALGGADARQAVFSGHHVAADGALNWDVAEGWRIKILGGWRNGDVVTNYRAKQISGVWVPSISDPSDYAGSTLGGYSPAYPGPSRLVTTFHTPFIAYRLLGHTWSYGLGVAPAIGADTTLLVQYVRLETWSPTAVYTNDVVSAGVVRKF